MKLLLFVVLLAVAVAGCSSSTSAPPGGPAASTGNSTEACSTEDQSCQETTGPASSIASQRSACQDPSQAITATCTLTPRIGCCAVNGGTTKVCYFKDIRPKYAELCAVAGGTWTPN